MKMPIRLLLATLFTAGAVATTAAQAAARQVEPEYGPQKVLFEFYFDHPDKIGPALYWVRSLINPLMAAPYGYAPEDLDIVVVIHGTEIAALVEKNYGRFETSVERMRYYADLGVRFRVCALALADFGYRAEELQDFVEVVPSAMVDLAHWQLQGYALIRPLILERRWSMEEIR